MPREWESTEERLKMIELALENAGIPIPLTCHSCNGIGYITHDKTTTRCESCNGKGYIE
jgi:DnaJ-class molecular chaperone